MTFARYLALMQGLVRKRISDGLSDCAEDLALQGGDECLVA